MSIESHGNCLCCQSTQSSLLYIFSQFNIRKCNECQTIFIDPVPTQQDIQKLFEDLYRQDNSFIPELVFYFSENKSPEHMARVEQDGIDYLTYLETKSKPGELLDLGCGDGFFLNIAKKRGWSPFGVDSSQEAVSRAKDKFGMDITLGTVESAHFPENKFDAVSLLDFIEHLSQPLQTMQNVHKCLKPGGIVLVATPNQASLLTKTASFLHKITFGKIESPLYRIYMLPHFLYFTPKTLTELLNKTGFEVVSMKKSNTDLRRLHLNPFMRICLYVLFAISNITGLQNRIVLLAKKV